MRRQHLKLWSPTFLAPWIDFVEEKFSTDWGREGGWFRDDSVFFIYCALYFCLVAISGYSTLTLGLGFMLLCKSNASADDR